MLYHGPLHNQVIVRPRLTLRDIRLIRCGAVAHGALSQLDEQAGRLADFAFRWRFTASARARGDVSAARSVGLSTVQLVCTTVGSWIDSAPG